MTTGITSILKNILKFIAFIVTVVAAVFLLRAFVIEPFVVPTGSMESTIEVGDCILAQKISLETGSDLKSGDIVVFKNPKPENGVDILVKRVIATSGQTVNLKDGKVYVDGRRLDESYATGESKPLDAHLSSAPDCWKSMATRMRSARRIFMISWPLCCLDPESRLLVIDRLSVGWLS